MELTKEDLEKQERIRELIVEKLDEIKLELQYHDIPNVIGKLESIEDMVIEL